MTTAYPKIDFYDISCQVTSQPWSPYTARTYLALRLLEIPFERHMLPMARIHDTLAAAGVIRVLSGRHLLPAITLNGKEWVTDSSDIADTLQKLYLEHGGQLSHSLFPDAASKDLAEKAKQALSTSLSAGERWRSIVPAVYYILDPESQEFFIRTRTESWKKSPLEILDTDAKVNAERDGGIDQVYAKAMQPFVELYANKEKQGTWLGGERPIYADIMSLALLQWFKCANTDAFHKGLEINGGALQKAWIAGQELFQES
ncbi:uncharacterized protein SPSC_06231 [Sporisorium scitamineum]|uniref:Uncharacterized protein n=1 Tax=Sporisorium scitamineum TaxID=49012 RepID=A0A0F7RUR3_9BASI|nr:hypothetical protein [Sporisorium scitamineum]CDU26064.1 uncharacterized protein SPSC_06231 [Sporisorium scitamineum]